MTAFFTLTFLLCVIAVCARDDQVVSFNQDVRTNHSLITGCKHVKDRGYVYDCDHNCIDISWEPEQISPVDRVTFQADFVSPFDLTTAHVKGVIWYEGTKMLTIDKVMNCNDIADQVGQLFPLHALELKCPIKRGQRFTGKYVYTDTQQLIGYDGTYNFDAALYDLKGNKLMCLNFNVEVAPFPDY